MSNHRLPLCVLLLSLTMGCHAGQPSSASSVSKRSHVHTYRAPEALCASMPRLVPVDTPLLDEDGLLESSDLMASATMDTDGSVELMSEGAPLGQVLEALAESAEIPIIVQGRGAAVPIFAMYESEQVEPRGFLKQVAASGGMLTLEHDGMMYVLDPHEAAEFQRAQIATTRTLSPRVTVEYPGEDAVSMAPALARTLLGCREQLTVSSELDAMWLRASSGRAEQISALLTQIEALSEGEHASIEVAASRRDLGGVAEPTMKPCELETKTSYVDTELTYTLGMRTVDLSDDLDVIESFVLGCGGMMHTDGWIGQGQTLEAWLKSAGMRTVGSRVYTTKAIATAWAIDDGGLPAPATDHVVTAIKSARAPLLVQILEQTSPELSPSLATRDVVLLRGRKQAVEQARQFALNIAQKR